ncbi:TATA-box-binding protein [Natronosalvus halobius]|uniref:TATA-box-binding protein n=1 Tax=Natronosalvus halobius TaxID=2953746 RepID=UPI00209E486C|nr:TATA-box-binding protein [Natronosalvus halobius]USZ71262.1 TATA-box-binding protein [Natronosalvus halobius]
MLDAEQTNEDYLSEDVSIANIVASARFDMEIELSAVAGELVSLESGLVEKFEHRYEKGNRLIISISNNNAVVILTASGVHVLTGAKSHEELIDARQKFYLVLEEISLLHSAEVEDIRFIDKFSVRNLVCVGELDSEVNLNAASIELGLENTEYEPEQFPGLIYRPDGSSETLLIFASGKIVITGSSDTETSQELFEQLRNRLSELLE